MTVVDALIEARKSAGLTQTELAERLKKHQSWVAKYEGRDRILDILEFYAVARALKQEPGELFAKITSGLPKRVTI